MNPSAEYCTASVRGSHEEDSESTLLPVVDRLSDGISTGDRQRVVPEIQSMHLRKLAAGVREQECTAVLDLVPEQVQDLKLRTTSDHLRELDAEGFVHHMS